MSNASRRLRRRRTRSGKRATTPAPKTFAVTTCFNPDPNCFTCLALQAEPGAIVEEIGGFRVIRIPLLTRPTEAPPAGGSRN
jgi:hypothetical protein